MKMTDLLRIIEKMRLMAVVILLLLASGYVDAVEREGLFGENTTMCLLPWIVSCA